AVPRLIAFLPSLPSCPSARGPLHVSVAVWVQQRLWLWPLRLARVAQLCRRAASAGGGRPAPQGRARGAVEGVHRAASGRGGRPAGCSGGRGCLQGGARGEVELTPRTVLLHVYDLNAGLTRANEVLNFTPAGMAVGGAFHAGVEVYMSEWSYGSYGVCSSLPRTALGHVYQCSILLGPTRLGLLEFVAVLRQLCDEWCAADYQVLDRNCCSFAAELVKHLGVGPMPPWVNRFARLGQDARDSWTNFRGLFTERGLVGRLTSRGGQASPSDTSDSESEPEPAAGEAARPLPLPPPSPGHQVLDRDPARQPACQTAPPNHSRPGGADGAPCGTAPAPQQRAAVPAGQRAPAARPPQPPAPQQQWHQQPPAPPPARQPVPPP
ncbi:unnamed protein product, partial [Prorocentrum cordatum]